MLVLEALALHDVAPVAGRVADAQQDGPVLARCAALERLGPPRVPVHGVVRVLDGGTATPRGRVGWACASVNDASGSRGQGATRLLGCAPDAPSLACRRPGSRPGRPDRNRPDAYACAIARASTCARPDSFASARQQRRASSARLDHPARARADPCSSALFLAPPQLLHPHPRLRPPTRPPHRSPNRSTSRAPQPAPTAGGVPPRTGRTGQLSWEIAGLIGSRGRGSRRLHAP